MRMLLDNDTYLKDKFFSSMCLKSPQSSLINSTRISPGSTNERSGDGVSQAFGYRIGIVDLKLDFQSTFGGPSSAIVWLSAVAKSMRSIVPLTPVNPVQYIMDVTSIHVMRHQNLQLTTLVAHLTSTMCRISNRHLNATAPICGVNCICS